MDRPARAVLLAASAVALAALVLGSGAATRAAESCHENTLTCECLGGSSPVASTAPGQSCSGTWRAGDPCDGACYDLRVGLLQAVANRSLSCHNEVTTADDYALVNVLDEPAIFFHAELHVTGTLSGSATALAGLAQDPMNYAVGQYTSSDSPVDERLAIPVFHASGASFLLAMDLHAALGATPGMADLTATLEFTGLPEGAGVASCQGYTMPVPVVAGTWARVKATYR
jgi:hypothetical protein